MVSIQSRFKWTQVHQFSLFMFLQYFVWGSWYVSIGNYLAANGMRSAVPTAYSVGSIAAILSPFLVGKVTDRFSSATRILSLLHLLGGMALVALPHFHRSDNAWPMISILFFYMTCYMPTLGLSNAIIFQNIPADNKNFPFIRVFGTIGWLAAGWTVSKVFHADSSAVQFYIAAGASIFLSLFSLTLPDTTPKPSLNSTTQVNSTSSADSSPILTLLKDRSFFVFVTCSFLLCIPLAAYYTYVPLFVREKGYHDTAFYLSFGQLTEMIFMILIPYFLTRLGIKKMLAIGMIAWVVRYFAFSMAAVETSELVGKALIFFGILLHGISYEFFFVTGQIYVNLKSTPNTRAQLQGFLVLITNGIGMLAGIQISGALIQQVQQLSIGMDGWKLIWTCCAGLIAMVAGIFILFFKQEESEETEEVEETPKVADRHSNRKLHPHIRIYPALVETLREHSTMGSRQRV